MFLGPLLTVCPGIRPACACPVVDNLSAPPRFSHVSSDGLHALPAAFSLFPGLLPGCGGPLCSQPEELKVAGPLTPTLGLLANKCGGVREPPLLTQVGTTLSLPLRAWSRYLRTLKSKPRQVNWEKRRGSKHQEPSGEFAISFAPVARSLPAPAAAPNPEYDGGHTR